jgi:trehalose 6-phosphate phosphatase
LTGATASPFARSVIEQLEHALRLFCFVDYDGTLAPLAPTPAEAYPLDNVPEMLIALAELPDVDVAIVTGRALADLNELLDVPGLYYVGTHGLEVRLPNGETLLANGVALIRSLLPSLKRRLQEALGQRPGILIEDKGAALACHYRLASADDAAMARQLVHDLVREYRRRGTPLDVLSGHEVIEVRPLGINKGKTVAGLLAQYGSGALAIYAGDDRTDEDAFRLLPADAITIRVGPSSEPTAARYRLAGPEQVLLFLEEVLQCRLRLRRGGR